MVSQLHAVENDILAFHTTADDYHRAIVAHDDRLARRIATDMTQSDHEIKQTIAAMEAGCFANRASTATYSKPIS
ncbi:MAG: hypothetical protein J6386_07260 [Candidatus Synoicihabitans palmerolidicus]|nr:hypothetical protein [Candidatus Synoicihabitans palmerolidicus]